MLMRTPKQFLAILLALVSLPLCVAAQTQKTSKPAPKTTKPVTQPLPKPALLQSREQQLLDEINYARANPTLYVKFLEQYRTYYRDKSVYFPDGYTLVTNEGVSALEEAITFLRTLKPLPPLELRPGMISGAKLHVDDMQKTGRVGHLGSDGSKPEDRLTRFGMWEESVGEDIVYDSRSARNDVIGLIIDDGVSTRGHRNNLFKPTFRVIGLASQPIEAKTICVITFAGGFVDSSNNKGPTRY